MNEASPFGPKEKDFDESRQRFTIIVIRLCIDTAVGSGCGMVFNEPVGRTENHSMVISAVCKIYSVHPQLLSAMLITNVVGLPCEPLHQISDRESGVPF